MVVQTLLSRQDLAKRWNLSIKTIEKYENDGVIQRVKNIPAPRYSIDSIRKLEGMEELNPLSPEERIKLEKEIKSLRAELSVKNELLSKVSFLGIEALNLMNNV